MQAITNNCLLLLSLKKLSAEDSVEHSLRNWLRNARSLVGGLLLDPELITLLKTQYRMNKDIMAISSSFIYKDELIAAESVKDRSIQDLSKATPADLTLADDLKSALIWIDTAGSCLGDNEESKELTTEGNKVSLPSILQTASKFNEGECELVKVVYRDLRELQKLSIDDIGVIAPYKAQVDLIRNSLTAYEKGGPRCEVSTVDGFQGREKEVIVLSLVRSNPLKEIGFLSDVRRLNVAITRPKRLLVVIGDSLTVTNNEFIKVIFETIKEKGQLLSVFEVMDTVKMLNDGDDYDIRKHFNSGTHLTQAHLKVKDSDGKQPGDKQDPKKKDQKKNRKKSSAVLTVSDTKPEVSEDLEYQVKPPPLPDLFNNKYSIDNDLYSNLQSLAKASQGDPIKVYRKMADQELEGVKAFVSDNQTLDIKISKRPFCVTVRLWKDQSQTKDAKDDQIEGSSEEDTEERRKEREKEEEKERKLREKRQRQKEAKKKKKEDQKAIAEMDEDEYFEMLDKEKAERLASQKLCPIMIGNTGKKCLKNIQLLGLVCKFCENKFCAMHVHATMHGCDDAEEDYYEQQRKEQLRGLKIGSDGGEPMNEAGMAFLQAKLRRMREEEEAKRKPKKKDEEEDETKGNKKPSGGAGNRGGRGGKPGRGGKSKPGK